MFLLGRMFGDIFLIMLSTFRQDSEATRGTIIEKVERFC
jgi:hypothetical protein